MPRGWGQGFRDWEGLRLGSQCLSCGCTWKGQLFKGLQVWTPPPQHTKPRCGFLTIKVLSPLLLSAAADAKLWVGAPIPKK